jgi:hypothetical protein
MNKEGLALQWPVFFDYYQSVVWSYTHAFTGPAHWTKCSILLMEMSSKLPGFIKCWPRCLNHNVAIASQLQWTCEKVPDACSCLSHLRLFTSPSLINVILNDTVMLITLSLFTAGFYLSWIIIIGSCSFSTSFHHKMPLVMHTCEKLLCHLPRLVVETHEQELQNGRWLLWAEVDQIVPLERRH